MPAGRAMIDSPVRQRKLGVVAIFVPFNGPMLATFLSAVLKAPDQEAPQALQSGIGRRYGEMGLEPFFEHKTVWIS